MKKLLVILGPTATGKTDLALQLASKFQGELIACDSRQVYTGLDIGTGKYPNLNIKYQISNIKKKRKYWEIDGVKIWMYDVVSPKRQYTVADYVKDANKVISNIVTSNKLPIVVGGTGLYLKALLEGLPNLAIPMDRRLRRELSKLSLEDLQSRVETLSPSRWKKLNSSDRQNPRRLLRTVELSLSSLRAQRSNLKKRLPRHFVPRNDVFRIGLIALREVLYKNVDLRVLSRISQGMIQEAEELYAGGLSLRRMKQLGLEYGVLADYIDGRIKSKEELIKVIQNKIHGYVRRQLTWFKKEKSINWFDITSKNYYRNIEKLVRKWYDR